MPEASCETALRQLSDLLAGDLDGGDAAALDRHLTACDACYRQAVKLFRQDRAFTEMSARSRLDESWSRLRRELRPRRRWMLFALPVAAAALAAVAFIALRPSESTMVLELAAGDVRIDDGAAKSGDRVGQGQGVETRGLGSRASIRFADSTLVELSGQTAVRNLRESGGKRVTIVKGAVAATVAPQPEGQPMIFESKSGEARVLGTNLRVIVDPDLLQTRLEVAHGQVRLTRWADNKSVDVPSGHFAVAAPGVDLAVRTLSKGKAPTDLHELDYPELRDVVSLRSKAWANLPWTVSLGDARERAFREQKPIFMVVTSGHPLNWVGSNGITIRERLMNDPDLGTFLAEKFVLLALDNELHPDVSPEEKAWLERFDSGYRLDNCGLGIFMPQGKKITTGIVFEPRGARNFAEGALRAFSPSSEPLQDLRRSAGAAPPEG